MPRTAIYVEAGSKRAFAVAVEWPGWSRAGRNEEEAIAALLAYGDRYAGVVRGVAPFSSPKDASGFEVVKRLKGDATTDFGAPSAKLPTDAAPIGAAELERLAKLLTACWTAFDRATKAARGLELRTGPRGGGRDLEKMSAHVMDAEKMYLTALGARAPKAEATTTVPHALQREAVIAALRARAKGLPVADPSNTKKLWTPRFFARRAAWHVLDHAWEIEDRAIRGR